MLDLSNYQARYKTNGDLKEALWLSGSNETFEVEAQLAFMKRVGLKPRHKFLDFGCGCLRGSAKLVDYLNDGNFYGADISEGLISAAPARLQSLGIEKSPNLQVIFDYNLSQVFPVKFDFILSVSILTHLYPVVIPDLFTGISKILKPTGVFYFTIYPATGFPNTGDIELARYNRDWLALIGKQYGLVVEDIEGDYPNPSPMPHLNIIDRVNTPELAQWVMKASLAR